jgi:hypothetical protein
LGEDGTTAAFGKTIFSTIDAPDNFTELQQRVTLAATNGPLN